MPSLVAAMSTPARKPFVRTHYVRTNIAESYNYLMAKYGSKLHFIIAGDTNRLNLSPILNLSPRFKQVVKTPTRLNPDAILDPIITTLSDFYQDPVTKPPIQNDEEKSGKPSDHLVVLMRWTQFQNQIIDQEDSTEQLLLDHSQNQDSKPWKNGF